MKTAIFSSPASERYHAVLKEERPLEPDDLGFEAGPHCLLVPYFWTNFMLSILIYRIDTILCGWYDCGKH